MSDEKGKALSTALEGVWFSYIGRMAAVAALPLLAWGAVQITTLSAEMRVLKTTIDLQMTDRYRGSDAMRDFRVRDVEIEMVKQRLSFAEQQLRDMNGR